MSVTNLCCVGRQAQHIIALRRLLSPGDEVILPAPYWVSYYEATYGRGVPVIVETTEENGFRMSSEQFEAAITNKTKCFILQPLKSDRMVYYKEQMEASGTGCFKIRPLWDQR
jgi:aspartate aminotransferase